MADAPKMMPQDPNVRPEGMDYYDPVTKQWMVGEPAAQDSSFLPFGLEDYINPAGWSRAIAKKILNRGAKAAMSAGLKETAAVEAKAAPKQVSTIIDTLKSKVKDPKVIDQYAETAASGAPVRIVGPKGLESTLKKGDPTYEALRQQGQLAREASQQTVQYAPMAAPKVVPAPQAAAAPTMSNGRSIVNYPEPGIPQELMRKNAMQEAEKLKKKELINLLVAQQKMKDEQK